MSDSPPGDGKVPPLALAIQGQARFARLPARPTLARWVNLGLGAPAPAGAVPARLTLRFVDRRESRRLNRDYRGRDKPTNVLTFAYETNPELIADLVFCVALIRDEAREQGKDFREHLAHLVIHGVLHARGFDHELPRAARRMEALETRLLAQLGLADPYLVQDEDGGAPKRGRPR